MLWRPSKRGLGEKLLESCDQEAIFLLVGGITEEFKSPRCGLAAMEKILMT